MDLRTEIQSATIGAIKRRYRHSEVVFSQYGLNDPCYTAMTLKEASRKRRIRAGDLVEELVHLPRLKPSFANDHQTREPDHLIDHLQLIHYRSARAAIEEITSWAARVARAYGKRYPENREVYSYFIHLSQWLNRHFEEAESILFPLIGELYTQRLNGEEPDDASIDLFRQHAESALADHEEAAAVMSDIRDVSYGYTPPRDACITYRILYRSLETFDADLHQLIEMEKELLSKAGLLTDPLPNLQQMNKVSF